MKNARDAQRRWYQNQVKRLRKSEETWPGKSENESAETLYPNIAAEINASGHYLHTVAEHAGVTCEILAAVIEDREELTFNEMMKLAGYWQCNFRYLCAGTLQVVDGSTNKGKARLRKLRNLMAIMEGEDYRKKDYVEKVCAILDCGETITYANYRWAVQHVVDGWNYSQWKKGKGIRTTRVRKERTA